MPRKLKFHSAPDPNKDIILTLADKEEAIRKSQLLPGIVKLFSLGGLGEVGMNMYVIECDDEILVIDSGILFSDDEDFGINYIIPDFTYLKQNERKILGLFITHGHEDHIGSIPMLLEKVRIPAIYVGGIAQSLVRNRLSEYPNIRYNLQPFESNDIFKFKHFEVSFFRTNHSIPDSVGIAVRTSQGYIVNTGDFKFDLSPIGNPTDYFKIAKLGETGVLCLLSDSTNSTVKNFSISERKVSQTLKQLFNKIEGRIIVATFASNVYRVQQIIEASSAARRKVAIFGHSMEKIIDAGYRHKYITAPKELFINYREASSLPPSQVTILCTGSQGEPLAALSRIANGTHRQIKLQENDTVIYSSKPIPGNELFINRNINKLIKAGANVIKNSPLTDTHTTGHASAEELKLMLALTKPKYFMPVHGEYHMLKEHAYIAFDMGMAKENCFCLKTGDVLSFKNGVAKVNYKEIQAGEIYLDQNLSDVSSAVLKERKLLADEGFVSLVYLVHGNEIIGNPSFISKGFMDVKQAANLTKEIIKVGELVILDQIGKREIPEIRSIVNNRIAQFIYERTERRPFLVTIIKGM